MLYFLEHREVMGWRKTKREGKDKKMIELLMVSEKPKQSGKAGQ